MPKQNPTKQISISEIESLRKRAENGQINESDLAMVISLCVLVLRLLQLIEEKNMSIARLKKFIFGTKSEKRKIEQNQQSPCIESNQSLVENSATSATTVEKLLKPSESINETSRKTSQTNAKEENKTKPGHGRLSAEDYVGAKRIYCPNTELEPKDKCPHEHCRGHLYDTNEPQVLIKREARPIIDAILYQRQVLRCSRCGDRFTASLPNGVNEEKYDVSADVMIAILHYSGAMPFYRLERMQEMMGVPLSASNQYERSEEVAKAVHPIFLELERQGAKLDVLHTDDTRVKILSLIKENKTLTEEERKAMHTTGIKARSAKFDIALYYNGELHSGENLYELLKKRPKDLTEPILMADAESKNWSFDYVGVITKCLVHGRRQFVNCQNAFEQECSKVINELGEVYKIEEQTKNMTASERLAYHQKHSLPIMDKLKEYIDTLLIERQAEPNNPLGKACKYMQRHWFHLTQFLRIENCPLDNNTVERALRKAVILRKNSLFYKTENGAMTGSVLVSVIETCCINNINPFDYLISIMKNKKEVRLNPSVWLPWNYHLQNSKVA